MPYQRADDVFGLLAKPIRKAVVDRGFPSATEPQTKAIPHILEGKNVLLIAPTGTGKTEAAFLPILSALITTKEKQKGIKVLYITPLRALNRDLLERLEWWCKRLDLRLAVRHGDTEVGERSRQALVPPDILITTPETLQAVLAGKLMRKHLKAVKWVVVDEVHELAVDKRGSQLSLALERLRYVVGRDFQLIGLSATIGTPERVAKFLVGEGRPCEVVKVPVSRFIELEILHPEALQADHELASGLYTYPEVAARLRAVRELVEKHRSTLIFTNTRAEAEILGSRFRVWDPDFPIAVHHGSLSRPTRVAAERDLKEGALKAIICTSSLELGIDIGLLEFVIQYNSPRQVTRILQRVGRSGHKVGGIARGVVITRDSDDALEAMVISRRALLEDLEPVEIPMKPYDVLVHQLIGLLLNKKEWSVEEALGLLRRAHPYHDLSEDELLRALEYMSERYPRLIRFSHQAKLFTKPRNLKAFYTYYFENLSMIPEEKQFLVLDEEGAPIGVLDEAFVAEHGEVGKKFIIGGRVWRIIQVYQDKVYVKAEEDPTGAIPSWVGEEIPVPYEVALEVGTIRRLYEERAKEGVPFDAIVKELSERYPASEAVISRALLELKEQYEKKLPIPTDRRIIIERWGEYIVIQCCFGHLVNRTISRALGYLLSERYGFTIGVQQDPYRIILKAPQPTLQEVKELLFFLANEDLKNLLIKAVVGTGIFKRRFLHVAKKIGAVAKDADLSSVRLSTLIEGFKGTVVYDEAIKTFLQMDCDIERAQNILRKVANGELEVTLVEGLEEATPTARIGLEELGWKADLVSADRMKKLILQSTKARLLSEARTLVCTSCWDYVKSIKISELAKGNLCPRCGSSKVGLLNEPEERVEKLCEKVHVAKEKVPKRFRRMYKSLMASSQLISKFGFSAVVALAGRGLRLSDVDAILRSEPRFGDRLVELILEAERRALRRRFQA